jgi:predicted nucleic acid-binding protein
MAVASLADPTIPLPDYLLVDSSVLLAARHGACDSREQAVRAFLTRVGAECVAGRMACLAPDLVVEECYFVIIKTFLRASSPNPKDWHGAYKNQPACLDGCRCCIERFRRALLNVPVTIVTPEDLAVTNPGRNLEEAMRENIFRYHLLPKDAYLLAVAERLGVTNVASLDQDWSRATAFTVYTC